MDERQHEAQQRSDPDDLGNHLPASRQAGNFPENACGEESPQTCYSVNGDCTAGIVDVEFEFEELNCVHNARTGDEADDDSCYGRDEDAACATGDKACDPTVGDEGGVGFAIAEARGENRPQARG